MSPLPPPETNSQNRELNFLKQTISALREQLENSLDLHDSEIQSLEENNKTREHALQSVITQLRSDYEQLGAKQNNDLQCLESAFAKERRTSPDWLKT